MGKTVQLVESTASPALEIVGVVNDVRHFTLDRPPTADLYVPLRQMPASQASSLAARMFWVVRARIEPSALALAVRDAVLAVDPGVATSSARTLATVLSTSLGARRANVLLLEAFGQIAVALCAIGVYAIAAFSARMRSRELAIRAALGARRRDLTMLLVWTELWPVATGIACGLAVAFLAAPLLFGTLFETDTHDITTYVAVAAGLLVLSIAASFAPLRRASATNPAAALQAS